jgi:hypothetical protein
MDGRLKSARFLSGNTQESDELKKECFPEPPGTTWKVRKDGRCVLCISSVSVTHEFGKKDTNDARGRPQLSSSGQN